MTIHSIKLLGKRSDTVHGVVGSDQFSSDTGPGTYVQHQKFPGTVECFGELRNYSRCETQIP